MKYIIMCGGYVCNWEVPKHFWKFEDEELPKRIVRQLREHGIKKKDIAITTSEKWAKAYKVFGAQVIPYESNNRPYEWVDAFYPMDEPTCYLFGDVVYSEEAIQTIIDTETSDIEFFASAPPFPPEYPKQYAEPFAFKVVNQQHLRNCISKVKAWHRQGVWFRDPIAWELWQVIKNTSPNIINYHNYTVINDYTCDMDWKEEQGQWGNHSI